MKNVEDAYPLSPTQTGMLFHSLVSPGSGVYMEQLRCRIRGPLDIDRLRNAWQKVFDRHPALRTAFVWDGVDEPLQVVRKEVSVPFETSDWSDKSAERVEADLESLLSRDRASGFDTEFAPLSRISLFRISEDDHLLVWTFHHIMCDGWSSALVIDEVNKVYAGTEVGPPPSPIRNYMAWLLARDTKTDLETWTKRLEGFSEPTIIPESVERVDAGYRLTERLLGEELGDTIRNVARLNRVSTSTLLHAAWAILLSRYCDTDDVVFGSTFSGRPTEVDGIQEMIGMFINTMPIRVRLNESLDVSQLLQETQAAILEAQEHQYVSLTDVQRCSAITAEKPLFATMIAFENYPTADDDSIRRLLDDFSYHEQSNYPIALLVVPGPSIRLILVYDSALYDAATADRIVSHLEYTLRSLVRKSNRTLADVTVIPEHETQLLDEWNATFVEMPYRSIVDVIAERTAAHPDRTALVTNDRSLTYDELMQSASRISGQLQSRGIATGDRVGLLLPRSAEAVISMLAVLRIGATYVPIDPTNPESRIRHILKDAECSAVIQKDASWEIEPLQIPVLDITDSQDGQRADERQHIKAAADDLAYIIYTSGSTGTPKGVKITHDNLHASTKARFALYDDVPERFLLIPSPSFDSSVAGTYWTLSAGGTLVIPGADAEQDMVSLANFIRQHEVTHTLCLPSIYRMLLEFAPPTALSSLKVVVVAGESCPSDLLAEHFERLPDTKLYNEYGPTEATVWATVHEIKRRFAGSRIPIGKPIANARLYVVDGQERRVPRGVPGELLIAGRGVSPGYVSGDRNTEGRFGPASFNPDEIVYRTGDLVRTLESGDYVFEGRVDSQLKIRGVRIEPGEIEAALRRHPDVLEVAVTAVTDDRAPADELVEEEIVSLLGRLGPVAADEILRTVEQQ